MLISRSNTIVEFTLSVATQEEWHVALRSSDPGHAVPGQIDALRCRVVFESATNYKHLPRTAAFTWATNGNVGPGWTPPRRDSPVRENRLVAVAARALVMQLMIARGTRPRPRELVGGSLFVDLGKL
jgi:hypothetical protein